MTAYRHAVRTSKYDCGAIQWSGTSTERKCLCIQAEPDPASPCGYEDCDTDSEHRSWRDPSVFRADQCCLHEPREDCHPHIATRCLNCHHALEADRA